LNEISPQALKIYDFNWFGQVEISKSVFNMSAKGPETFWLL